VRPHEKVARQLPRFECVEWLYDGLKGKIIPWTKQHGGTSDDPSVQAFVVARDGSVLSRCPNSAGHAASPFARWLDEQAKLHDKRYPRTKVPFAMAEITRDHDDRPRCGSLEEARESGKPILLYVGRDPRPEDERRVRKQIKAAQRFEKGTLGSKKAAEAARGWVLLRLNLAEKSHAAFASTLGVEAAPALLMFLPGEERPVDLGCKLKGPNLAFHLNKHAPR
jgi:hypothetical protein